MLVWVLHILTYTNLSRLCNRPCVQRHRLLNEFSCFGAYVREYFTPKPRVGCDPKPMSLRSLPSCRRAAASAASASKLALSSSRIALPRFARCYATPVTVNGFTQLKPTRYGQPLAPSHPHLVSPKETTPGIPQVEYDRRRRKLMERLPDGSLVVCVAGQIKYMSGRE